MAIRFLNSQSIDGELTVTGNVGIGNNNPIAKLFVDGGALGGTAGNEVALLSLKTTNSNTDTLQFTSERLTTGTNWTSAAQRIQRKIDTTLMGYMQFGSHDSSGDLITFGKNATEYMRIDGFGRVGIGTTSPSEKLEVVGNVEISNDLLTGNLITARAATTQSSILSLGQDRTGNGYSYIDLIGDATYSDYGLRIIRGNTGANTSSTINHRGTGNFKLKNTEAAPITFETTNAERMRITAAGNVGIGTTSPAYELDVVGDIQYSGTLFNGPRQEYVGSNFISANQAYTGNLVGSYFVGGDYQKVVTIIPSGASQNYQIVGNIYVQSGASTQVIKVNASLRSNTLPDLSWEIYYEESNTGTRFVKPFLWTKETTTAGFIFGIEVLSGVTIYGSVTADLMINSRSSADKANVSINTVTASDQLTIDTGYTQQEFIQRSTWDEEKLGIGTTDPSTLLHVSSESSPSIRVTGITSNNSDPAIELLGTANSFSEGGQLWYDNGSGVLHLASLLNNTGADIQFHTAVAADRGTGNVRMTIAGDGNVGIGTTSPDSELHIASGNPVLTLQDTNSNDPNAVKIEFTDQIDDVHAEIGLTAGNSGALNIKNNYKPIEFYTGTSGTSTLAMQIDDNGNVGIGITNPTAKLHVNGGLRVATVNEATTYSADKFLVADPENVKYVDAVQLASLIDPYVTSGGKFVDGTDPLDAVYTTGNVGIGTTAPTTELDVSGDIKSSGNLLGAKLGINYSSPTQAVEVNGIITAASGFGFKLGNTNQTAIGKWYSSSGVNYLEGDSTRSFQIGSATNGVNVRFDNANNRVGIGTTSPTSALSVNGVYTGEYPVGSGLNNVVMGVSNAGSITTGVENFIVGQGNLTLATSINRNTVSGQDNARLVSSSSYNTFFGYRNMYANTGATSYNFMAGLDNLYSSIGSVTDNVLIGRNNGYTTTAAATNAVYIGRDNGYYASGIGSSTMIGWRNCYSNTNLVNQNNIIGYGNLYNVDADIVYNNVMGYQNANNATDVDYCSLFGYRNAFDAGNLDYTSLFGRDNGYNSSSITYSTMSGYANAMNATSTITDSALFGRQNAMNGFDIQNSTLSGFDNAKVAEFIRYSSIFGRQNALSADQVQYSLISGDKNGYTTTSTINNSMLVGYQNGYAAAVSLDNTILLGFEQGYSVGSQGAADYRLAIGMYRDNPLIYGEFDSEVVKINGSLTVTDRTGGAATKSAFFDSTGQLIEGDPASTISFAISDETSDLTVGQGKLVFRMPYAMTITDVRASVTTPPTGSTIIVDIDQGGSSIFTTNKLSIDAGEKTSTTAATPPNITTTALNDDVEIIVNIDQVGSTVAGTGLKVYLIGTRA